MSFEPTFSDPIIYMPRKGTSDDPFLNIKELVSVINSKALLTEVPDKFNRVTIVEQVMSGTGDVTDGIDGGAFTNSPTINSSVPIPSFYETDGIPSENQYTVDYNLGIITFHPSQEGSKFVIQYTGRGNQLVPASRIYTQNSGNNVTQTLNDVVTTGNEKITEITTSIDNANQATINANNATANYQTLLNQQSLIYQASVATFTDIATTYPTPALGWTTVAKDTGIRYRYNGSSWVDIGTSSDSDGFRVTVSQNPPPNTNVIWVDVPSGNYNAKVVQSDTAPVDTSVIWWKP